jgi:predicted nucleotidyltransferase
MHSNADSRLDAETNHAAQLFTRRRAGRYEVLDVVLFGSRARRGHRSDSDADLAVLLRGGRGSRIDVSLQLADIAFDVMLETGILIEAIPFWEDEWAHPERFTNPALIDNIRREGIHL